jgi:hypothetical protein
MHMTNIDQPAGAGGSGLGTDLATPPTSAPSSEASGDMKEQAKEAASTAASEGKHVTSVAGEEAQKVVAEAKQQTQALLDDAKTQLHEQSRSQRDRLVQTLGTLGDDLDRMAGQADSGLAGELVQKASERVRGISSRIDGREPAELLEEVRDFARRKPGTFLLGALAAGVVAGRFARGAQKAHGSDELGTTGPSSTQALPTQRPTSSFPTGGASMGTTGTTGTAPTRTTPSAPAMASFPADQPGVIG